MGCTSGHFPWVHKHRLTSTKEAERNTFICFGEAFEQLMWAPPVEPSGQPGIHLLMLNVAYASWVPWFNQGHGAGKQSSSPSSWQNGCALGQGQGHCYFKVAVVKNRAWSPNGLQFASTFQFSSGPAEKFREDKAGFKHVFKHLPLSSWLFHVFAKPPYLPVSLKDQFGSLWCWTWPQMELTDSMNVQIYVYHLLKKGM